MEVRSWWAVEREEVQEPKEVERWRKQVEGDGDEVTRGSKTVMDASVQMSIKNHGHMKRGEWAG